MSVSGGTDKVRYFISAGAYTQDGLFNSFNLPYDVSYSYKRFNYRANFDINVTKSTLLSFNVAGNVDNNSKPHTSQGTSGMIKNMYYATPFSSPGIVDGKLLPQLPITVTKDFLLPEVMVWHTMVPVLIGSAITN